MAITQTQKIKTERLDAIVAQVKNIDATSTLTASQLKADYLATINANHPEILKESIKVTQGTPQTKGNCIKIPFALSYHKVLGINGYVEFCSGSSWQATFHVCLSLSGHKVLCRDFVLSPLNTSTTFSVNTILAKGNITFGIKESNLCVYVTGNACYRHHGWHCTNFDENIPVDKLIEAVIHAKYKELPTIPIANVRDVLTSLIKLRKRAIQTTQPRYSLSMPYTIGEYTATGYQFLYGSTTVDVITKAIDRLRTSLENQDEEHQEGLIAMAHTALAKERPTPTVSHHLTELPLEKPQQAKEQSTSTVCLTGLSLEKPEQWSMSWTTLPNVYRDGEPFLETWAATLTDTKTATQQFWPTIANYGLGYNLLMLQKVTSDKQQNELKAKFEMAWTPEIEVLAKAGHLYVIDMSIFTTIKPQQVDGFVRFTPATITLLQQDPHTKDLTPIAIRVSGNEDNGKQIYTNPATTPTTDSAWLYALQAAKTSISVYGIWLGHVYQWHIVTAAMQMTLKETIPENHPISNLLSPISNYLIPFDTILLILWRHIAPPTSISTASQFLDLNNTFAKERNFFDDDPLNTLARYNIEEADFTTGKEKWNKYPIVGIYQHIWDVACNYVTTFVEKTYTSDDKVKNDQHLKKWITASRDLPVLLGGGNIKGLPSMDSKEDLKQVLTSLVYRVTIHGVSRLNKSVNPALTFVANFPPCLQDDQIPSPTAEFDTKKLLQYMPKTGTIGKMMNFGYTFVFSSPYKPLVPMEGVEANLFFGKDPDNHCNQALITFREAIIDFMKKYENGTPSIYQWPLNVET